MKYAFLILGLFSLRAFALETDNYLVWGKELGDAGLAINRYFREGIENALSSIPEHSSRTCDEMTRLIGKDFASHLVHDNPVENWLFRELGPGEIYPQDLNYVEESIYREPFRFYIPWFGLAPNIQVSGYYFGTDKLSHFASTGMIYFKVYHRALEDGASPTAAERKAIDWGVMDEKSVHGFWASGVFSYADLESNFQGLRFYRNFCEGNSSYLKRTLTGNWVLENAPRIQDFVSGYWDESFELSYRLPENWERVAPVLKSSYCGQRRSSSVQERFSHYRSRERSTSMIYLRELRSAGKAPVPQSFDSLCR